MSLLRQVGWSRALRTLLLLFFLIFLLIAFGLLRQEIDTQTTKRLNQAIQEIQLLQQQRDEINQLLNLYNNGDSALKQEEEHVLLRSCQERVARLASIINQTKGTKDEPSLQYERLRRKLKNGISELWYFVSAQVKLAQKDMLPQQATRLNRILDEGVEHKRALLKDVEKLGDIDGYAAWRAKEAAALSDLVQRRLRYLQNPKDCSTARKLLCNLNKRCGYGCQLHHVVSCLIVAYGTKRTMVLKSQGWIYHRAGWEEVFKPVSDTCTDHSGISISFWPGKASLQVVILTVIDSLSRPPYLPLAVPLDLAPRIARLHGDPIVWWVGQMLKYLLRPQASTTNMLETAHEKFNFQKPIVGVHIRRTDKVGTEAAFHSVEEYMPAVEEYYSQLALTENITVKRIYLASDEPTVFADIKNKYPEYVVLGDPEVAKTASVATRYSDSSLNGIIMDIHFLSLCDYLVCTFSSTVCRVAYEIMQSLHPDAADRFRSLDDIYYYGGQGIHRRIAVLPHRSNSPDQIDLNVGDNVGVAGNHWDGYSKGRNLRTNKIGLYPSFKVVDLMEAVEFPAYKEVPLETASGI